MEMAVIADIHSNLYALKAVLEDLGDRKIYHVGDLVGYNPFPREVIELLQGKKIPSVMGNHDYAVARSDTGGFNPLAARAVQWTREQMAVDELGYLSSLPPHISGENFHIVHGSPQDPLSEYVFPGAPDRVLNRYLDLCGKEILILGHTHVPMLREVEGGLVLNPGSVGQPRDGVKEASYALLDTASREAEIVRVPYPIEKTARAIEKAGLPQLLAERLYLGK